MTKFCLPPVVDARTRLLVLGSLPGEVSLAEAQYYAHRQNQFWRLIGEVAGADLAGLAYPDRLEALLSAGIGLWDVVKSARREGSLDGAIRDAKANALADFVASLPALRAVAFNGATAARIGRAQLGEPGGLTLIDLPSSSPALTLAFGGKAKVWLGLRDFLDER
jgi:hypoxanthine-DNA glycosylase